jgi:TonB family protein
MVRHTGFRLALGLLFVAALLFLPVTACCQSRDSVLTRIGEGYLDSLAAHAAQKIREANLEERVPKVLVIDFFRSSPGNSSRLGTLLADRFSESLTAYSTGLVILDRRILKDYLTQNWTTLEDLQSRDVCLRIGRQMGATGVILGTLYEENGQISLTVHLEGFGPVAKEADIFQVADTRARFPVTEEMHAMLFEPGPNYARKADDVPEEPGVFKSGLGAGVPRCTSCPTPDYSDAARAAKLQGTVVLSIVVTTEGKATSIYVLKGAPLGLTAKAIEAVQNWRFEPALKDGNPVPVRVQVEATFRID